MSDMPFITVNMCTTAVYKLIISEAVLIQNTLSKKAHMSAMFGPHVGRITVLMSYWGFNDIINSFSTGVRTSKQYGLYTFYGSICSPVA